MNAVTGGVLFVGQFYRSFIRRATDNSIGNRRAEVVADLTRVTIVFQAIHHPIAGHRLTVCRVDAGQVVDLGGIVEREACWKNRTTSW